MNALDTFICGFLEPTAISITAGIVLLAAFYGCGRVILHFCTRNNLVEFALGCAVFVTLFAILPSEKWLLWGIALPFAIYGAWLLAKEARNFPLSSAVFVILFLFFMGSALMIPYSWDEQTYQLALPLRYLQCGNFSPVPDNPYSYYPALTSWFFANCIKLGGITLPRIIISLFTPIILTALWHLGRRCGRIPAWTAAAAVAISPLTLALNRGVYVENFITLFTLAGVVAAWRYRKKNPLVCSCVCGILAGAAVAVKPTGVIGALMIMLIWSALQFSWKKYIIFAAAAFLTGIFWYLRTYICTGNIFYPYSLNPVPGTVEYFHGLLGRDRYGLEGVTGVMLNWIFAGFYGRIFDGIVTGVHLVFLAVCGLLFWWQSFRTLLKLRKVLFLAAASVILPYLLWTLCFPQTRFIIPLIPITALAGAIALCKLPGRKILITSAVVLFSATFIFQSAGPLRHYLISWRIFSHVQKSPGSALPRLTGDPEYFKALEFFASLPQKSKILLLFERRGLYVPRNYTIAVPGFEPSLTPIPESSEKLFEKLLPYDYIMVGSTTRDVDLQSANMEDCKKVLEQIKELIDSGKLHLMPVPGFPVLKIVK